MMKNTKYLKSIILLLTVILVTGAFAGNKKKFVQKGWYIRLVTTSNKLTDKSTVFGYLQGASDWKDKYDSEVLSSGGAYYLYTTINHPEFVGAEEYRSDYRAFQKIGEKSDTWTIVVHCGDTNADITLSWDGVTWVKKNIQGGFTEKHRKGRKILGKMKLLDETNDQVIDVNAEDSYTFNMKGNRIYTLKWVLFKDAEEKSTAAESPLKMMKTLKVSSESEEVSEDETVNEDEFSMPSPKKKRQKKSKKKKHHKKNYTNYIDKNGNQ